MPRLVFFDADAPGRAIGTLNDPPFLPRLDDEVVFSSGAADREHYTHARVTKVVFQTDQGEYDEFTLLNDVLIWVQLVSGTEAFDADRLRELRRGKS
jgi:hypothetical protein